MRIRSGGNIETALACLRRFDPLRVYLFGSWARGEEDELSDLDLVVIMHTQLPFLERALEISKSFPLELGAVDLLIYTPDEWEKMRREGNALVETVLDEGRIIYEQA